MRGFTGVIKIMREIENKYFNVKLKYLPWDSGILGIKCGVIEILKKSSLIAKEDNLSGLLKMLLNIARKQQYKFLVSKINAEEQGIANACFLNKGILIDTELIFIKSHEEKKLLPVEPQGNNVLIKKFNTYWNNSLFKIAESFTYSRFHKDNNIKSTKAIRLWRNSIHNNCHGRASYSIICFVNKKPVGIMNVFEKNGISEIFLIGLIHAYQNRGLGGAMMKFYEKNISKKIKNHLVETSILNYKAQNLYLVMGYRNNKAKYVIHFWF